MLDNVYNTAGDLARDKNKGLALIEYDFFGNTTRIQFRNGNVTEYVYSAAGQKLKEKHTTAIDGLTVSYGQTLELTPAQIMVVDSVDYAANLVINAQQSTSNNFERDFDYHFDGGYLSIRRYSYTRPNVPLITEGEYTSHHYFIQDHQGNNRVVVAPDGTVEQTNDYYAYGGPWGNTSTNQGFQPFKYNGKELDRVHGLDWYDYGARRYDPAFAQFTQMDPLCEKYPHLSPYAYCAGNPVRYVDPDGNSIYMLFYTIGNSRGDDMFRTAAETRKNDIMKSASFNSDNDIVVIQSIDDLGQIGNKVDEIIQEYSQQYGRTAEFSIWSHAGLDGPTGTVDTSQNAIDGKQLSITGWASINFNWDQNAKAGFFGCKTGVGDSNSPSFVTKLSANPNFKNVEVFGQTSSAYPSTNKYNRTTTKDILRGYFKGNIYMVGSHRLGIRNRLFPSVSPINPWRKSINGKGYNTKHIYY